MRPLRLVLLAALLAPAAAAQSEKSPGTAQAISFVVPGGGHLYAGETVKGTVLLGGAVAGLAVAATALPKLAEDVPDRSYYTRHGTTFGLGLGAAGLLWLYGVVDSPGAARRANRRVQAVAVPRADGGATVAVRVAL